MKKQRITRTILALSSAMLVFGLTNSAYAQFSKAVVVMKGTVRAEQTGKPHSVRVSVREIGDRAMEITGSRSNSESGYYLVVLKPSKKYWVHFEGDGVVTKDELIETPAADKTQQIVRDFNVSLLGQVKTNTADESHRAD